MAESLTEGLETLGTFVYEVFNSPKAMYFLTLLVLWIMLNSILRRIFSKIPLFEGSGDLEVNAQGKVISAMLSLLSVMSIGWGARGATADTVVNAIAGPFGLYMIVLLSALAGYGTYKNLEAWSDHKRRAATIIVVSFIFIWMTGYASGAIPTTSNPFLVVVIAVVIGFVIALIANRARRS